MAYEYDPYGGEQIGPPITAGSVATTALTYPFQPSSYLSLATLNPRIWSPNKGIDIPFRKLYKDSKQLFNKYRDYRKTPTTAINSKMLRSEAFGLGKRFGKGLFPLGMTESERVGGKFLGKDFKKRVGIYKTEISKYQNNIRKMSEELNYSFKAVTTPDITNIRNQYKASIQKNKSRLDRYNKLLSGASKGKRLQSLSKLGIRTMKGASYIGIASMAWDIASLVGKPIVQAGMNAVESIASEYQTRFMPEMGGQLQLSYLSQGAATERQRSIQAISKAYINGRSAFGSEGSIMHS